MERLNCWEFMRCGREPKGSRVAELGVCPAATFADTDGFNSGKNGGRVCWEIAGTFCIETIKGTFVRNHTSCSGCDFFRKVQDEELTEKNCFEH
jgi:hypothetical protein